MPERPIDQNARKIAAVATEGRYRNLPAGGIAFMSISGVIVLAIAIISAGDPDQRMNRAQPALTGALPLFGARLGTVLAEKSSVG